MQITTMQVEGTTFGENLKEKLKWYIVNILQIDSQVSGNLFLKMLYYKGLYLQ